MSSTHASVVHVKIYDREYSLRTTGDPERLQALCHNLDRLMREVATASGSIDTLKVAILAAITVADDLDRAREALRQVDESLSRRSLECVSILDRCIEAAPGRGKIVSP